MEKRFPGKVCITESGWPSGGGSPNGKESSNGAALAYYNTFSNFVTHGGGGRNPFYFMYHDNYHKGGYEQWFGLSRDRQWKFDVVAAPPMAPTPAPTTTTTTTTPAPTTTTPAPTTTTTTTTTTTLPPIVSVELLSTNFTMPDQTTTQEEPGSNIPEAPDAPSSSNMPEESLALILSSADDDHSSSNGILITMGIAIVGAAVAVVALIRRNREQNRLVEQEKDMETPPEVFDSLRILQALVKDDIIQEKTPAFFTL
jgi:hypothetical protein